jgi:hypothetical protein
MRALGRSAVIAGMAAVMVGLSAGAAAAGPAGTGAAAPALAPFVGPWAGYIDANPAAPPVFHTVSTLFKVPPLNCAATANAGAIQGVSIDGYLDATMEQAGVEGICTNGVGSDLAGWEISPMPGYQFQFAVNTGDVVQASVTYDLHLRYTLAVRDITTGQAFAVVKKCTAGCDNTSAEVITQAAPLPHGHGGILADFGRVVFYNITVSDYTGCAGLLVRPACWQTVHAIMAAAPPTHHATASLIAGGDRFENVWAAVP